MKQTAVGWLQKSLSLTYEQQMQFEGLFQQAMTMEQEQTIDFAKWMYNYKADINKVEECFEQYYNETYNQIAKNIYTVIVFMSDKDIDWNDVRSFTSFDDAECYAQSIRRDYTIIPNKL